jgi:HAD superfamily hydrolase (TIGR01509 family)
MTQPDLIIFDCDGVLIDSEVLACRTDAACLAEIGIAMSAEEILDRYLGVSASDMFADIELHHGRVLPPGFPQAVRGRIAAVFETDLMPMEGIEAVLQVLPHRRCVASSSAPARVRQSLSLTGLLAYFEPHIFSATQVAHSKPAPDLFLFAAAAMQAAPETCLVVEDSVAGVSAAVAAGMRVIGFTGGGHCRPGHAERLRNAGASAVCDDMRSLPALVSAA